MKADVAGGGGEGVASRTTCGGPPQDQLPLPGATAATTATFTGSPSHRESLDVEVALPKEWHEEPMALDPDEAARVD